MSDEVKKINQVLCGGQSSGKTYRALSALKEAIDEGKTVRVYCPDSMLETVKAAGIPEECIFTESQIYHAKTQAVFDSMTPEMRKELWGL